MTGTSRGIRLRNPGDIRISPATWHGKITPSLDPDFETFDCIENGIRAVAILLLNYYTKSNVKTLREMATRYAPPTENDTGLYIDTLADRTGFDPDATLSFPDDLQAVVEAFIDAEQGEAVRFITADQFADGVKRALQSYGK